MIYVSLLTFALAAFLLYRNVCLHRRVSESDAILENLVEFNADRTMEACKELLRMQRLSGLASRFDPREHGEIHCRECQTFLMRYNSPSVAGGSAWCMCFDCASALMNRPVVEVSTQQDEPF